MAKCWFDECATNHRRCNAGKSLWRPRRLVWLGDSKSNEDIKLGLLQVDYHSGVSYATLSHCWGAAQIIQLRASSLDALRAGIAWAELPNTFKDAIVIAREIFEIRYIWIDSLCIIQDSEEDWLNEGAVMADVYKNSSLNIAATGATDSNGGLFFGRQVSDVPIYSPPHVSDRNSTTPFYRRETIKWSHPAHEFWKQLERDFEEARLNNRAWVLQERIFAPRTLHFFNKQLLWECRELEACESFPFREPKWDEFDQSGRHGVFEEQFIDNPLVVDSLYFKSRRTPFEQWAWIVETFTRSGLTVLGDKLNAMAGIVSHIKSQTNGEYLAGLWRQTLVYELLWETKSPETSFRPLPYRAPSWSWVSVEGAVQYSAERIHLSGLGEFSIDSGTTVVDAEVTGSINKVTAGFIKLKGAVCVAACMVKRSVYGDYMSFTKLQAWNGSDSDDQIPTELEPSKSGRISFDILDAQQQTPSLIYLIALYGYDESFRNFRQWPLTYGLVLAKVSRGTFRRLGRFTIDDEASGRRLDAYGNPTHTITII